MTVDAQAGSYTLKAGNDCGWSQESPGRSVTCVPCEPPVLSEIIDHFLGKEELSQDKQDCLDKLGNENGKCDLGDLRRMLGLGASTRDLLGAIELLKKAKPIR